VNPVKNIPEKLYLLGYEEHFSNFGTEEYTMEEISMKKAADITRGLRKFGIV
jgi:hypothetical protein